MTGIKLALAAATLLIATAAGAAATDESRYRKVWDKSTTTDLTKPKVGCVCPSVGRLGTVTRTDDYKALCTIPVFDATGTVVNVGGCSDFIVLPK